MLELEHRLFQLPFFFIILMFKYEIRLKVTNRMLRCQLQLPLGFVQHCIKAIAVWVQTQTVFVFN